MVTVVGARVGRAYLKIYMILLFAKQASKFVQLAKLQAHKVNFRIFAHLYDFADDPAREFHHVTAKFWVDSRLQWLPKTTTSHESRQFEAVANTLQIMICALLADEVERAESHFVRLLGLVVFEQGFDLGNTGYARRMADFHVVGVVMAEFFK